MNLQSKIFQGSPDFIEKTMNKWFETNNIELVAQTQSIYGNSNDFLVIAITFKRIEIKSNEVSV